MSSETGPDEWKRQQRLCPGMDRPDSKVVETGSGNEAFGERWHEGVAIVGMAARFPGCASVDEYWDKLLSGKDLLSRATDEDMRSAGIEPGSVEAEHFVRSGTWLAGAENLDANFFDLSRREAEIMDPQQRIFLECAYEALEHAGMTGDGERTGVFAGSGMNTYMLQLLANPGVLASAGGYQLMLGNDKDFLATRVAYKLNLRGPAVVLQTACSTSLAAVHLACRSLLSGECDSALAGGVSVMFPQVAGYSYIPGMILSPDGVCRPFDESARGTVPGKGAGVVVLKRESDALKDGDTIYAVIAGSAWNNDGSDKAGYTAPSVEGQVTVIRAAHAAAGVTPDRVVYVEAHGTGTELGDPIEVAALAEAFGERPESAPRCLLGSVKSNMGHADVAAGVAGLIKTALALHHGRIPPMLHFERPNPALRLEQTPFRIAGKVEEWPGGTEQQWAGVSSFGIGGTNVHVCMRNAPRPTSRREEVGSPGWVFNLSAKTAEAVEDSVRRLLHVVESAPELPLASVAATLQLGRRTYAHRCAVVAGSHEELVRELRGLVDRKRPASGAGVGHDGMAESASVAFLFPGQGQQFRGMAAALYREDEAFGGWIDRGLAVLPGESGRELLAYVTRSAPEKRKQDFESAMLPTSMTQPLLFLVEYALAMRWMESGIKPAVLLGHSLGELTAAAVAEVFTFEDGLSLAVARGSFMQGADAGAMLAVSLGVEEARPYLTTDLWIAAENGPKLTVLAGAAPAIEALTQQLAGARVGAVRLATDRAFHTPSMAEAATLFRGAVAAVKRMPPQLPWLSNVSGTWITPQQATSPDYWMEQMTARVRFRENAAIVAERGCFLLEAGPGNALSMLVRQQGGARSRPFASSLGTPNRTVDDRLTWLKSAARLWEEGVSVDWEALPQVRTECRRIALPTYPFERERHWIDAAPAGMVGGHVRQGGREAGKRKDMGSWFYVPGWKRTSFSSAGVAEPASFAGHYWVVLEDGEGFGSLLADGLEAAGARVGRLAAGESTRERFDSFWKQLPVDQPGTQVSLVDCRTLRGVAGRPGAGTHEAESNQAYAGLLLLLQSAQMARIQLAQVEIILDGFLEVTGERVEGPGRAVIEGMAVVLPAEFAGVPVRLIDPELLLTGDAKETARLVLAEIAVRPAGGMAVAYRHGRRWEKGWQPLRLAAAATHSVLRTGGTYVITGGLGGISYLLARHLLSHYGAKVALIGRSTLPARHHWEEWLTEHGRSHGMSLRIERAKELERLGGELLLLSADVADRGAMEAAWNAIEERFGPVHGVVHAAGLAGGARIAAQTVAGVGEVLRPKVRGSEVLAGIIRQVHATRPVDFLMFCSSISALLPVAGAADYAAANAFEDCFALWCRQHWQLPAVSANFDAWREVGMAAEMEIPAAMEAIKARRLESAMTPEEGVEVCERILASGEVQVLVSTIDFPQVLEMVRSSFQPLIRRVDAADRTQMEDSLAVDSAATAETQVVMAIWQELLGVSSVQPGDNFFALGGHSLLGTMVLTRIRERYGTELTIRAIFEAPTPELLAALIRETRTGAGVHEEPLALAGEREEFEF